jgi:hypothetical protein
VSRSEGWHVDPQLSSFIERNVSNADQGHDGKKKIDEGACCCWEAMYPTLQLVLALL